VKLPETTWTRQTFDALSWAPDGTELVYMARDSVRAVNVATGASRVIAPFGRRARWSPDGREIAFIQRGTGTDLALVIVDRNGGARRVVIPNANPFLDFTWSGDGTRFILHTYPHQLISIPVAGGEPSLLTDNARHPHWCGTP
jgi:Tol biopolymer transport system component